MTTVLSSQRSHALHALSQHLNIDDFTAAKKCLARLLSEGEKPAGDLKVLVAYGGGKDSSFMTAFVRLMQLILSEETGQTFKLRIATNRHAAMSGAVMSNIDRVYRALAIPGDPDVEALLIDGNDVKPFAVDLAFDEMVRARNRRDILMHGHRFSGQARSTFCNACNISMVNSFAAAGSHDGGVDVIVTGDSVRERASYVAWVGQLARRMGLQSSPSGSGMGHFLKTFSAVSEEYYKNVYGREDAAHLGRIVNRLHVEPKFFTIYNDTSYSAGDHWNLLVDFLGFQFDDIMFSFSESDCGNPTIMAHMRGLRAESFLDSTYEAGLDEYVEFGLRLMRKKDFPAHLIETMRQRFAGPQEKAAFRVTASAYAFEAHGLTEANLLAMLHTPLVDRGTRLDLWIKQVAPHFAGRERDLHRILGAKSVYSTEPEILCELEEAIGLGLKDMQSLYAAHLVPDLLDPRAEGDPLALVLKGDPHRAVVARLGARAVAGEVEVISGR